MLRCRKQITGDEEEKWKIMYRVLFPDDDPDTMPTPCKFATRAGESNANNALPDYEDPIDCGVYAEQGPDSELDQLEAFIQQELPLLARQEIEHIVDEASELDNGFRNLRQQLPQVFQDLQLRLLRLFRQNLQVALAIPIERPSENPQPSSGNEPLIDFELIDDAGPAGPAEPDQASLGAGTNDFISAGWQYPIDWSSAPIDTGLFWLDDVEQIGL